jgi:hypothetical protein
MATLHIDCIPTTGRVHADGNLSDCYPLQVVCTPLEGYAFVLGNHSDSRRTHHAAAHAAPPHSRTRSTPTFSPAMIACQMVMLGTNLCCHVLALSKTRTHDKEQYFKIKNVQKITSDFYELIDIKENEPYPASKDISLTTGTTQGGEMHKGVQFSPFPGGCGRTVSGKCISRIEGMGMGSSWPRTGRCHGDTFFQWNLSRPLEEGPRSVSTYCDQAAGTG